MRSLRRSLVLALAVGGICGPAMAEVWDSGAADSNFTSGLNWDTNLVPPNNGTANLFFGSGAKLSPNANVPFDVNSITFNPAAASFALIGSQLTLRSGGITNSSVNSQSISNPLVVANSQLWTASAGNLAMSGPVSIGNLLSIGGNFNTTMSGVVSGTNGLIKNGGGTLTLGFGAGDVSANTWSGTTINSGTITLDKATGVSAMGGSVVMNDGTLNITRVGNISPSTNMTMNFGNLNANGAALTLGSFNFSSGFITMASLTLSGTAGNVLTWNTGFDATITWPINFTGAGGGGFAQTGTGVITLAGPLNLGGIVRTFTINDIPNVLDDQVISGTISAGSINKAGAGTLTLTGANTYSGGTILSGGMLRINSDAALGSAAGSLGFNGGALQAMATMTVPRQVNLFVLGGSIDTGGFDLTLSGVLSGSGALTKNGAGTLVLGGGAADTASNFQSATTTVNGGTLSLDKADGVAAVAGNLVLNNGATVNAVRAGQFGNSSNITVNSGALNMGFSTTIGSLTFISGGISGSTSGITLTSSAPVALTMGGGLSFGGTWAFTGASGGGITLLNNYPGTTSLPGAINLGGVTRTVDVADNVIGDDLIILGQVSNGGITKNGAGTLALLAVNTFASPVTINSGTIRINADNGLGAAGTALNLSGTLQTSSTFTLSHPVSTNFGAISVDPGTRLAVPTVSGNWLFKQGDGTLVLGSGNTIIGNLFAGAGTIALTSDSALGSSTLELGGGTVSAEGGLRTLANPLQIDGAFSTLAGSDMLFNGNVTVTGGAFRSLNITNTTTLAGIIGPAGTGRALTKEGQGTLVLKGNNTLTDAITINQGTLEQAAGTLNAPIKNNGKFVYTAGSFNSSLTNFATVVFNSSSFTAGGGVQNNATMDLPVGMTLTTNGFGLFNQGTFVFTNAKLLGSGEVNNSGIMSGSGSIEGNRNFTNTAQFLTNGPLDLKTIAPLGFLTNSGEIDIAAGGQLTLLGSPLNNTGVINMGGGWLQFGTLRNLAGGTVTGRGFIGASLNNSAGNIVVSNGTLNIILDFTNSGAIQMSGITATLSGGAITNNGTIQGFGTIANVISNTSGSVEAIGGTMILSGAGSSSAGLISAASGNKLLYTKGLATNSGAISLTGGTFDNGNNALNNKGQISGYGTFRSGGLDNNGSVTLTGGVTTVNGDVTNEKGNKVEVRYTPAIFTGTFTNNGIFKNTSAQVTFSGAYIENGTFLSDPADNFFQNVTIRVAGAWSGGVGDRFFISGDLQNNSVAKDSWQTSSAELSFVGGQLHQFVSAAQDLGIDYTGYDDNFAWGKLVLGSADSLDLHADALYVRILSLEGGLAQLDSIIGNGGHIYYDLAQPENVYLHGQSFSLSGGGSISPVPEPLSTSVLFITLGVLTCRRRKPILYCKSLV